MLLSFLDAGTRIEAQDGKQQCDSSGWSTGVSPEKIREQVKGRVVQAHPRAWDIDQQSRGGPGETGSSGPGSGGPTEIRQWLQLNRFQSKWQLQCPEAGHGVYFFTHTGLDRGQPRLFSQTCSHVSSRRLHSGEA